MTIKLSKGMQEIIEEEEKRLKRKNIKDLTEIKNNILYLIQKGDHEIPTLISRMLMRKIDNIINEKQSSC